MDIQIVERLAAGGVSLEQARDLVEVGGPEWSMIGRVIDLVEGLIEMEVRGAWPSAVPEGERP